MLCITHQQPCAKLLKKATNQVLAHEMETQFVMTFLYH